MNRTADSDSKPRLLVLELWGIGDLVIASPFLRAAAEKYAVTLLAKPFAAEMRQHLWPNVEVLPFVAPWTAFKFGSKYGVWRWPWTKILALRRDLRQRGFDYGVSGRWDPRDHWFLATIGARERLGFPRMQSGRWLTRSLPLPDALAHRTEYWRTIASSLGVELPRRAEMTPAAGTRGSLALIHTGARLPARIWPMPYFQQLAIHLREEKYDVRIACDANQLDWWRQQGEPAVCPKNVNELFNLIHQAGIFIGNCSGPGHLAAISGVPTFTIYGPSLHEWWAPIHPDAEWIEGKACPYKPCSDYCRFEKSTCLSDLDPDLVWPRVKQFADKHLRTCKPAVI